MYRSEIYRHDVTMLLSKNNSRITGRYKWWQWRKWRKWRQWQVNIPEKIMRISITGQTHKYSQVDFINKLKRRPLRIVLGWVAKVME